ncbi:MAG TPA: class I SAM-dependent methyltransferase [Streptosporangiaceae bacterium]|nr:class I SAM-dependent methyltransferase [Streptosporangiaceae bacterium]
MSPPSLTSQAVALTRAAVKRPHSPDGDPDSQQKLCAGMRFSPPAGLLRSIAARTAFVDDQVLTAIAAGLGQIVICGAGYDDRALRFRTSGIRFFELDHPDTQQDKARRLKALSADAPAVTLAAADFRCDDAGAVLAQAGHDASEPSLFICEGLLIYLDGQTCHRLLAALADHAAAGSVLAASLSTHADGADSRVVAADANSRRRNGAAEPWQTILPAADHLARLEQAGWVVTNTQWAPASSDHVSFGRRSLLVQAKPFGR